MFELLWQPLEESLKGVKAVYFSPAGHLSKLNLGAIPTGEGKILSDRYNLVQLGSTRQLVVPPELKIKNNDALLFGGIQYEMDSTAVNLMNIDLKINRLIATRGGLSFSQTDSTLRGGTWDFLPGTEKEVVLIEKIMQTSGIEPQARKGWAATEEAFKTIGQSGKPSPRILHLATHGFFFPDPKTVDFGRQTADGASVFKTGQPAHPLWPDSIGRQPSMADWEAAQTRHGRWHFDRLRDKPNEFGQYRIGRFVRRETGLGDVQGNEGVYGLQRAFKIAGAKYLIMSLWQVPDQQTSLLMTAFYKKWLSEKMEIPVAFRAAQKELRDAGLAPYQWAGFVLVE
ncbi:MAG: CHAT domain-containing protein [Lewinellaceae bacterium]|nr:CHAT domain-containing protein [Lewinellaceae bacterium]